MRMINVHEFHWIDIHSLGFKLSPRQRSKMNELIQYSLLKSDEPNKASIERINKIIHIRFGYNLQMTVATIIGATIY